MRHDRIISIYYNFSVNFGVVAAILIIFTQFSSNCRHLGTQVQQNKQKNKTKHSNVCFEQENRLARLSKPFHLEVNSK